MSGQGMSAQESLPCTRCQPVEEENHQLKQALRAMSDENTALAEELAGSRSTQRTLEAQLRQARSEIRRNREEDPAAEKAEHLINAWMRETGRATRKGRKPDVSVSGKRGQTALKALRMINVQTGEPYTLSELEMALIGLGLLPFVGGKGRKALGEPKERYDEIEHALRDEPTIDRFISYARRGAQAAAEQRQSVWDTYWRINEMESKWARLALDSAAALENGLDGNSLVDLLLRRDEAADAEWVAILSAHENVIDLDARRDAA